MPSIEELRQRKEQLELEAQVAKLQKQKDRREAVEKAGAAAAGWDKGLVAMFVAAALFWVLAMLL